MEVMNNATSAFATIQNATTPRTVATWTTQVASTPRRSRCVRQIKNTDVLFSGEYAKTLTFSLSTTTP